MKVKVKPIVNEMQTSKEIGVKSEEKFTVTEKFADKISIDFLNDETTTKTTDNKPITSNNKNS